MRAKYISSNSRNVLRKAVTSVLSKNAPPEQALTTSNVPAEQDQTNSVAINKPHELQSVTEACVREEIQKENEDEKTEDDQDITSLAKSPPYTSTADKLGGRHRIKKRVVVGNISKYIPPDKREGNDRSTHKWMVYVRGGEDEPRIDHFVRKVWFFLHPSYRPNDLVEVTEAPFHLTRRGWGEFPIRVQLHFCDPRNRRIDIIHQLRLDRTYTGLQTLGAETVCDIELEQSTVGLKIENLLSEPDVAYAQPCHEAMNTEEGNEVQADDLKNDERNQDDSANDKENTELDQTGSTDTPTATSNPRNDVAEMVESKVIIEKKQMEKLSNGVDNESMMPARNETEEEMDVDEENEADVSEPPAASPDKRRRRRKGDSCNITSPELAAPGSPKEALPVKLLDDSIERIEPNQNEETQDSGKTANDATASEATTLSTAEEKEEDIMEIIKDNKISAGENSEVSKLKSTPSSLTTNSTTNNSTADNGVLNKISTPPLLESNNNSPTEPAEKTKPVLTVINPSFSTQTKKCIILSPSNTGNQSASARLRSFSADGNIIASSSVHGKKIVYLKNSKSELPNTTGVLTSPNTSGNTPSKFVVVRPRSDSLIEVSNTELKAPTGGKSSVTILKPLLMNNAQLSNPGPIVLGRKRAASYVPSSSSGAVVLSMIPDKRRKLSNGAALIGSPVTTKIAVPLSSIVKNISSQSASSSTAPSVTTLPISAQIPNVPVMRNSPAVTVSNQVNGSVMADSVQQANTSSVLNPPAVPESLPGKPIKSPAIHKSYILKNTKQGLVVVSQNPAVNDGPKPTETALSTEGNSTQKKALSQQQLLSLMALQSALLGGAVSVNKPMQIKIEKPTGQHANLPTTKKNSNQQFVLTTVTNEQGKKQLALVSADRMKETEAFTSVSISTTSSSKDTLANGSEGSSSSSFPMQHGKTNASESVPLHKAIGNKILRRKINDLVKDALPLAARCVPLVRKGRNITNYPFCAETESDFLEWNIGKQRAAERQRASLIHRVLTYVKEASTTEIKTPVPSKRFIINWCLTRGYSVFTDEYVEDAEDSAKEEAPPLVKYPTPSLSCHEKLTKSLQFDCAKVTPIRESDADEIDIISVTPPTKFEAIKEEPTDAFPANKNAKCCVHSAKEIRAIDEMANQIEVKFDPAPIASDIDGPLSQIVLMKAMELFVSGLMRESLASSLTRRDGENRIQRVLSEQIEVLDVVQALQTCDLLDTFTDKYMGV
ncbi:unnamed protein product [Clavelina lepadiformis]|uniref:YEATS domain-containing protein n=1 Tax=Clavelina lepadiformis TaxID=159417 RepID=A0ABP0H2H2_CLALP